MDRAALTRATRMVLEELLPTLPAGSKARRHCALALRHFERWGAFADAIKLAESRGEYARAARLVDLDEELLDREDAELDRAD